MKKNEEGRREGNKKKGKKEGKKKNRPSIIARVETIQTSISIELKVHHAISLGLRCVQVTLQLKVLQLKYNGSTP